MPDDIAQAATVDAISEASPAVDAPAAPVRSPVHVMAELVTEIVDHLGNAPRFDALMAELSSLL